VNIRLSRNDPGVHQVASISMPVGAFTDCKVSPTCGIADENGLIGYEDRVGDFYSPARIHAQILWSSSGYIEYKFPFPLGDGVMPNRIMLSFEACSEAPNYKEDWKSDITIWINGMECGTWQSPGDFGNRRGRLNPPWWDNGVTQYGKLVTLEVTKEGSLINSAPSSKVGVEDLHLEASSPILVKIGNKENAEFVGGFNLFGEKFGDYAQNITLSVVY
jgi:predicted transcriptional regulator